MPFNVLNNTVFFDALILFVLLNPKSDSKYSQSKCCSSHPHQITDLSKVTSGAAGT